VLFEEPIFSSNFRLLTPLDVGREVDLFRQFRDVHLKPILDLVQNLGVALVRHKRDGEALKERQKPSSLENKGIVLPDYSAFYTFNF